LATNETRHKVFVSYCHRDDQNYREHFEEKFSHLFISKSVKPGYINDKVSDQYIKRLIQEDYLSDTSVTVVLIGRNTCCRKHVDWEISATLNKKVGGYSGLIGILLPDFPFTPEGEVQARYVPPRLADNVESGYADLYSWDWICQNESNIKSAMDKAFSKSNNESHKIANSQRQFIRNRPERHTGFATDKGISTKKLLYTGLGSKKATEAASCRDVHSYEVSIVSFPRPRIQVTQTPIDQLYRQKPRNYSPRKSSDRRSSRPRQKPPVAGLIVLRNGRTIRQHRGTII
jgi:hypothetical protein